MEIYEKNIGFATIWRTLVRRWKVIVIVFVPIAIASFVATNYIMKKSYQSSVTMLNNTNLNATQHSNIQAQITKSETLQETIYALAALENPITIDSNQILRGLSITSFNSNNPGVVSFTFKDANRNIVQPVLKALSENALEQIKANGFANMTISKAASAPFDVSGTNKYLLIGVAVGAVLALGLAFIDEIISDEVYNKNDVELLGSPSFEITASK